MARYTGPVCRICRREGLKLFFKGDRCFTDKCPVVVSGRDKVAAPGQHGISRKKMSEYGIQLREKQKTRKFYGILEKQFRNYFDIANKMKGVTGENFLSLLESRLDNVAYRAGFAMSRPEARQLVTHGHFTVNGKKVNIPSYQLKEGDVIAIREKSRTSDKFKVVLEANGSRVAPKFLDVNKDTLEAKMITRPTREDVDLPVEEHLIVEFYSK
jgi:ribosomal protein S4, bacterial/organelle type